MQEINGNIWEQYDLGRWIVITTNGEVRKDGACVMGRGIAKQAADKFPDLPYTLGSTIKANGNNVHIFEDLRIITLPVKRNWRDQADLGLISTSLQQLVTWTDTPPRKHGKFYMVRPGCANGRRDWEKEVKPICEKFLDDRFVIVEWNN